MIHDKKEMRRVQNKEASEEKLLLNIPNKTTGAKECSKIPASELYTLGQNCIGSFTMTTSLGV
jgi:hypothetical protein